MKNALIIFMMLTTFALSAQDRNSAKMDRHRDMKENFTPEQKAELRVKKMTLELGLNENQQEKVKQLLSEMNKDKPQRPKNYKEMTSEQKYTLKEAMLDRRITFKNKMKDILTEEQFAKWEKKTTNRRVNFKQKRNFEKQGGN